MKLSVKYVSGILILFNLCACEKEIDLNISGQQRLVVNALFNPDSLWSVHVSKSMSVTSTGTTPPVNDAVIRLFEDGVLLEEFTARVNGYYTSSVHKPVADKTYRLQVQAGETSPAEATESMEVEKIHILSASYVHTKDASLEYPVTITFKDPPGVKNYYVAKVYFESGGVIYTADARSDEVTASSKDVAYYGVSFTDALFDGKEYSFKLKIFYPYPKIIVELQHVSQAYYQYHYTHQAQVSNSDDPFATLTEIFNNMSNGFRHFCIFSGRPGNYHAKLVPPNEPTTDNAYPLQLIL